MLDNSYYKYKKSVLDNITNNTLQIVDNHSYQCICDVTNEYLESKKYLKNNIIDSVDYNKYLVDCEEKIISVHSVNLPKLNTGEILCLDYYDYAWKNNLVHGNISWFNSGLSRTNSYKDAIVQEGQILYLGESFFENGFKYTGYDNKNTFVISDIDDDGIVVLPPGCSVLWCLDKQEINKIKKLIMIGDSFTPYILYIQDNQFLTLVPNSSYELVDVSNIDIEFYSTSKGLTITTPYGDFDTAINRGYNYKFNKAYCFYTPLSFNSTGEFHISLSGIFYNYDIVLDDFGKNIELNNIDLSWHRSYSYKLETEVNIVINNNIKFVKYLNISDSIEPNFSLSAYNFKTISLGKKTRYSVNAQISLNLLQSLKQFTNGTIFHTYNNLDLSNSKNVSILRDFIYSFNDIIARGYKIVYCINCGDNKEKYIDIEELYDYYTILYTTNNYGKYIDDLAENQLEYKQEYLDRISKLYGISKSNIYGDLNYTKAKELFCGSDKLVELKSIDIENSTIYMETGAGVDLLVNIFQFILLRMSGLCSYNIVTTEDKISYGVKKDEYFDNLKARELLVFSDITKNAYINGESSENVFCSIHYRNYHKESIFYNEYKNVIQLYISYVYAKSDRYNYSYIKDLYKTKEYKLIGSDIYSSVSSNDVKIKLLQSAEKVAKAQKTESIQVKSLLEFVSNSKHYELYGGKSLNCINVSKVTKSNLPKNLIMDSVYYDTSYLIFTLEDVNTKTVYKIEEKTLKNLLKNGEVYCENINTTLLEGALIWLMHDYDKQATLNIEHILQADMLFKSDEETKIPLYSLQLYELDTNKYGLRAYNIGEEFVLPSYIHEVCIDSHMKEKVIDTYGEDYWTDLKRLIIVNLLEKPLDVTNQILGLFKNRESIVFSKGIEFKCDANTIYKNGGKPLVVDFDIRSSLIELPQNLSLNFSYQRGPLDDVDTKIVIRSGSTIYKCKCATELEIADNVFIHSYAFSHSLLRKVTIHGGKIPDRAFNSSKKLTELIIDGGHVDISITAFLDCDEFSKITCINGGSYTLIEKDNPIELEIISQYEYIPFYSQFLKEYEETKKLDNTIKETVYPIKLNDDFTVTLKHQSGNESKLSLYQIYDYYKNGNLIFEFDMNGRHYNFVETLKYSGFKCLVFYPGINNYLCDCKLLLIMNVLEVDNYAIDSCKFVFAFQYDDWYNGNITDLPYSLLKKNCDCGFYFDMETSKEKVGIEFSFYQNKSMYTSNDWENFDFYNRNKSYHSLPDYDAINNYGSDRLDKLYFPASHSFDSNFRKQDNNLNKKNQVEFGLTYKYAKYMSLKKYRCKPASVVEIIPGIGENKLFVLNKIADITIASNYKYLWGVADKLIINTPTLITDSALSVHTVYDSVTHISYNRSYELIANADIQLVHCSVPFKKFKAYNSNVIYDCSEFNRTVKYDKYCLDTWKVNNLTNVYIELDKTSTLLVKGLRAEDLETLIDFNCYNLAYQLWNHNREKLESEKINKFLDCINDGTIKINKFAKVIKLPMVDIDITKSVIDYMHENKAIINIYDNSRDIEEEDIDEDNSSTLDLSNSEEFQEDILETPVIVEKNKKSKNNKSKSVEYVEIDPDFSIDFLTLGVDDENITDSERQNVFDSLNIDCDSLKEQALKDEEIRQQINLTNVNNMLKEQAKEAKDEQNELLNRVIDIELKDQAITASLAKEQLKIEKKARRKKAKEIYDNQIKENSTSIMTEPLDDLKIGKKIYDEQSNKSIDEIATVSDIKTNIINKNIGLASDLLSAINNNKESSLNKLIGLEFISKIIKNNIVIGYEVRNTGTNKVKKLSIETIEKLCKTGKYKLIGANYSLFSGIVIDGNLKEIYI